MTKLEEFTDGKINGSKKLKLVLGRVENIVGKGENAVYQHFLLFPRCFHKTPFSRLLKVGLCGKELKQFLKNMQSEQINLLPHNKNVDLSKWKACTCRQNVDLSKWKAYTCRQNVDLSKWKACTCRQNVDLSKWKACTCRQNVDLSKWKACTCRQNVDLSKWKACTCRQNVDLSKWKAFEDDSSNWLK